MARGWEKEVEKKGGRRKRKGGKDKRLEVWRREEKFRSKNKGIGENSRREDGRIRKKSKEKGKTENRTK